MPMLKPKPTFLLSEAIRFERLGGRVRFTVLCMPARQADFAFGLYELTVEADEYGIREASAMHGFDDAESPVDLTIGEATSLEDWAKFGGAVSKAASVYFDMAAEQSAEERAEDAAYASL